MNPATPSTGLGPKPEKPDEFRPSYLYPGRLGSIESLKSQVPGY